MPNWQGEPLKLFAVSKSKATNELDNASPYRLFVFKISFRSKIINGLPTNRLCAKETLNRIDVEK
jgi:hypothetical protein